MTDSGLPTTPHRHFVGRTVLCVGHTAHHVSNTEYDKKHLVIKLKIFLVFLAFSRVKN